MQKAIQKHKLYKCTLPIDQLEKPIQVFNIYL